MMGPIGPMTRSVSSDFGRAIMRIHRNCGANVSALTPRSMSSGGDSIVAWEVRRALFATLQL